MPRKLKPVTKLEAALYKALPELRSPEWFEKVLNAARNRYRRVDISKLTGLSLLDAEIGYFSGKMDCRGA